MRLPYRLVEICGGSRALAALLLVIAISGVACMLWQLIASFAHVGSAILDSWLALSSSPIEVLRHPWTIVSYMCLHYSPLHLLFNLLWFYWFGKILTGFYPGRILLWLFIGGGVAGGLAYVFTSLMRSAPGGTFLTGDSAAVLAVMAATGILLPRIPLRLFLFGEVQLRWIALACVLLTLAGGTGTGTGAPAAHLAGATWGVLFALALKNGMDLSDISLPRQRSAAKQPAPPQSSHNPGRAAAAIRDLDDHRRLDELLDKIRISGYDSLSEREKTELNHISSRIKK